ncbi:DoxX family protein [Rhodovarius crocodyli]|uniref:DoxX family protein n=1 Tax=Rhodovarius crocodyli TaxID=1979269 RepID=A0A437MGZ0_9PROT|nr:DoxX family protein [Rhodovarius crocodyli]RVT96902.1 DoxX family protein [Rhodovarius crocodyli]
MQPNLTPYAALLLRLSLGAILLAHGLYMKIMTVGLTNVMAYFGRIGFPPILAPIVAFGETAAGIALVVGVMVRPASVLVLPILIGAALQHTGNGWMFASPRGGWEFPVLLIVLAVVQALLGAGAFALEPVREKLRKFLPAWAV